MRMRRRELQGSPEDSEPRPSPELETESEKAGESPTAGQVPGIRTGSKEACQESGALSSFMFLLL